MTSSDHIHTYWQQGEFCCCLHCHHSTTRHLVAVCVNGRPLLTQNVTDPDEGARAAEQFRTLFALPQTHRDSVAYRSA